MTETLTTSNLFNSFAVWREILQGITQFTSLETKNRFVQDERYVQDEPNPKARENIDYPYILVRTDYDDNHITFRGLKQMRYTTTVEIRMDYFAEKSANLLDSYMNAIVWYVNLNQDTLSQDYGFDGIQIKKSRDRDEIQERQIVVGTLTFDYVVKLDVEN